MLCRILAWMNEYIVQIISATRLWLISRYSHHTLTKRRKMTVKNGHPCTEWFSSLCFQTIRKHMEKQSLICTRKTFYTDNITSTLMIVVFSINWLRMFALYVCRMCCKLELKTLNNRKTTASLRNHRKCRMCSDPCICTTQWYSGFFQRSFAWNLKNISLIVWYCCNIWHPYKISNILYKTNKKAVSFLLTTSGTSRYLSRDKDAMLPGKWRYSPSFSQPHGVFVWKHRKVCCGLLQWSDVGTVVWFRTFTGGFQELIKIIFKFSTNLGVQNESTVKNGIFPRWRFENCFLYLAEYSVNNFIITRQYLVNLTCNCWFRMCSQFHQKLVSY